MKEKPFCTRASPSPRPTEQLPTGKDVSVTDVQTIGILLDSLTNAVFLFLEVHVKLYSSVFSALTEVDV